MSLEYVMTFQKLLITIIGRWGVNFSCQWSLLYVDQIGKKEHQRQWVYREMEDHRLNALQRGQIQ